MDEITKRNIQSYDETVKEYLNKTKDFTPNQIETREEFISLLKQGTKIIDVGCGPGRDARFFSDRGMQVTGIDLSKKNIELAKKLEPRAKYEIMSFLDINYPSESFDGAWFSAGIVCVEKKHAHKILSNINRILKKQGILYVTTKEGTGEGFEVDKRYNKKKYYAYYQENEIKQLLVKTGFKIIKIMKPPLKPDYDTHQWLKFFCIKETSPSPE